MNIFLLEDDQTLSIEIEKFLTTKNFQCVAFFDGAKAIKEFNKDLYDLVILDINVPGQNGIEVCMNIRENTELHKMLHKIQWSCLGAEGRGKLSLTYSNTALEKSSS